MKEVGTERALTDTSPAIKLAKPFACVVVLIAAGLAGSVLKAQDEAEPIEDMTAKYHFLSADDTCLLHTGVQACPRK